MFQNHYKTYIFVFLIVFQVGEEKNKLMEHIHTEWEKGVRILLWYSGFAEIGVRFSSVKGCKECTRHRRKSNIYFYKISNLNFLIF